MARCINCKEMLPFNKVAFLSKRKNSVECPACHTILEGDKKQLGIIGGISGGIGGMFGFLTVYSILYDVYLVIIFFLLTIVFITIGAIIQNRIIRLTPKDQF